MAGCSSSVVHVRGVWGGTSVKGGKEKVKFIIECDSWRAELTKKEYGVIEK